MDPGFSGGTNCTDARGKDIVWPIPKNNSIKMKELGHVEPRDWARLSALPSLDLLMAVADLGFSWGMRQLPKVQLFCKFFAENFMKMKEFGPPGASLAPPPWIRQ